MIVNIRSYEGRTFSVKFYGVRETRAKDFEGMMIYAIVERGSDTPRQYIFVNWDEKDPASLEIGVHGIYIEKGFHGGCFLPQVASEQGWNKEQFLTYCCSSKAGLPPNAWKDPDTNVYLFTAQIVSEGRQ